MTSCILLVQKLGHKHTQKRGHWWLEDSKEYAKGWVGLEERRENDCSSEKSSYLVMDTPGTVNIDASASEGESNRTHFNREHQACL